MFNDRIYSPKTHAAALPSEKSKRVSRSGRRRGAAAPGAGPERRLDALNHDERDLRRPPHTTVPVYCDRTTPERRNLDGRGRRGPGAGEATMGDDWARKIAKDPTQWWYGMDRDHPLG